MSRIFDMKRGDTSPALRWAIETAVDLTGASVLFQMRVRRGATVTNATAQIASISPPVLRYNWVSADTATPGTYEGEFRVTYADGTTETFPNRGFITIRIGEDV